MDGFRKRIKSRLGIKRIAVLIKNPSQPRPSAKKPEAPPNTRKPKEAKALNSAYCVAEALRSHNSPKNIIKSALENPEIKFSPLMATINIQRFGLAIIRR